MVLMGRNDRRWVWRAAGIRIGGGIRTAGVWRARGHRRARGRGEGLRGGTRRRGGGRRRARPRGPPLVSARGRGGGERLGGVGGLARVDGRPARVGRGGARRGRESGSFVEGETAGGSLRRARMGDGGRVWGGRSDGVRKSRKSRGYRAGRSEFQEVAGRRAGRVRAAVTPTTGAKRSEGAVPAGKQRRKTTHPVATRRAGRAPIPGRVPPRSG